METFVEGFSTTLAAPQEQILFCLEVTERRWIRYAVAGEGEPVRDAYRRIVRRDIPRAPIMFAAVVHEGRVKSVNLYQGCVLVVHDPARGSSEIRTLRPEARAKLEQIGNVSETLERSQLGVDRRIGRAGLEWFRSAE